MFPFSRRNRDGVEPIGTNTHVWITEIGKKVVEEYGGSGRGFAITSRLHGHSPMTVGQIAKETGMNINDVKRVLGILEQQEIVRTQRGIL